MLPSKKISLNDVNATKRKSLILSSLVRLKNVQVLTANERIMVEDMLKKAVYRDLNTNQIEIIEKLSTKYGIMV